MNRIKATVHLPRVMRFYLSLSLVISLVLSSIYLGIYFRTASLIETITKKEAHSYYNLVLKFRKWNAEYGGVFVEKQGSVKTNPFLIKIGIDADVSTTDGRILTLRNPALMTLEIADMLKDDNGARFRFTSLMPINPNNAPDAFETEALRKFESGIPYDEGVEETSAGKVFRYMVPLFVDKSCLKCHGFQGYKVGDIRGGISVDVPYEQIAEQQEYTRDGIILLSILTIGTLLAITFVLVRRFTKHIEAAQEQLFEMSITDELTRLYNRRYFMKRLVEEFSRARREKKTLGALMFDLDHFKAINDQRGHAAGDAALRAAAETLQNGARDYDIVARYGGEEFIILLPETGKKTVMAVGERLRQAIATTGVTFEKDTFSITASFGAAVLHNKDASADSFIQRVDSALYEAKAAGRNRGIMAKE